MAILLTLICLAVQIRQAEVATLGQIIQSRTSEFNVLISALVTNGDVADIWVKEPNSETVTEAGSLRLRSFILMLWNQFTPLTSSESAASSLNRTHTASEIE